jgi:hypothetical protein
METVQPDFIAAAQLLADAIEDLGIAIVIAALIRGFLNK